MPEDQPETQPSVTASPEPAVPPPTSPRRSFNLLAQLPLLIALVIIAVMLVAWKPWDPSPKADDRTITVTGDAEITAEPDEYTFRPQYTFKNADKAAALAAATVKTNQIVAKLKALGVADNKIKADTSGYGAYYYDTSQTYYTYITVTIDKKALAQKVQDYLLTTAPYGTISPSADFSKARRKQLTDQGRDQATKDARAKAEQSARNLGFKLGKVKDVKDNPSGGISPGILFGANSAAGAEDSAKSLPIQPGENDLSYQVSVTYYLR